MNYQTCDFFFPGVIISDNFGNVVISNFFSVQFLV